MWIVAPAYYLAFRIFNDSAFDGRLKAVPEDEEGIDIEFLRRGIQQSEQRAIDEGIQSLEVMAAVQIGLPAD